MPSRTPSSSGRRCGLFAAAATLLLASQVFALGRDVPADEFFSDAPEQITWVTTCGEWDADGIAGFYRAVHAERHAQSFLYVQWMHRQPDGSLAVVATAAPSEVNNDHADVLLDTLRCVATKDGVVVSARASFGHDNTGGTVRLRALHKPGEYRFARRPR